MSEGAAVVEVPQFTLYTGEGAESVTVGEMFTYDYSAAGEYHLSADNLAGTGYFGSFNIPVTVSPADISIKSTTVTYYTVAGSPAYDVKIYYDTGVPEAPSAPTYDNYYFCGWNLSHGDNTWDKLFDEDLTPCEVTGYIESGIWVNTTASALDVYAEWARDMQFNLTAGDGVVFENGKYYIVPGTTVNITVSLKYNLAEMGWDPAKADPRLNWFNITASAVNFSVTENLTSVVYAPNNLSANVTPIPMSMSGNALKADYSISPSIYLTEGENEVILGNLTITAPDTWDGWDISNPFSITFDDALASNNNGALVSWTDMPIGYPDDGVWQSILAPAEAFALYPQDIVPDIYSIKYFDGRYVYEQNLDSSAEGPTFYLYNDIFNGLYSDASYGNFTLNLTKDSAVVDGYFWNTSAFGSDFQFNDAETAIKTNIINRMAFNTSSGIMDVALNVSGSKLDSSIRNISVTIEEYRQSHESNLLSGWFFDTPYNVTINVRPGPATINTTAGIGPWDSGIAYDEFENSYGSSTGYVWSASTAYGNQNVTFADNFIGGNNITVTKSDENLEGDDAVIILTGALLGDVNKNGAVNSVDASRLGYIIEKNLAASEEATYENIINEAAFSGMETDHVILLDCNSQGGDGLITIADLREMNKWLSHIYSGTQYGYAEWSSV